jgi:hypothetical protein
VTFNLHLSRRIITAERSTKGFTCMHVTSRIAGSPNSVSKILIIAIMALENRPILDESGSAFVARRDPTGQSAIIAFEIHWYSRDSTSVIF